MTPFTTRNDPLVAAAKKALETGAKRREVQKEVLEEMGGTHLRGMTNENRAKFTDEVNKRVASPVKLDESKKKVDLVSEAETKPNRGHNSPFDRGGADAHYGRKHTPHYYKDIMGDDGKSVIRRDKIGADGMHPHEIEEYTKGYQGADDFGDGKRLRHVEKAKPKNVNDVYREHYEPLNMIEGFGDEEDHSWTTKHSKNTIAGYVTDHAHAVDYLSSKKLTKKQFKSDIVGRDHKELVALANKIDKHAEMGNANSVHNVINKFHTGKKGNAKFPMYSLSEAPVEGKHFIKTKDLSKDKTDKESDKRIKASVNAGLKKKQIDEVSAEKLGSYVAKAGQDIDKRKKDGLKWRDEARAATGMNLGTPIDRKLHSVKFGREAGQKRAIGKLVGSAKVNATVKEAASIEAIMAEIKANGVDADKILEGRATGVPMIARSPQQTPVPAAERRPIGLQKGPSLAQRNQSSAAANATPVSDRKGPVGKTLNGPTQASAVMPNNATPTAAPAQQSSQGFDEKGFEGVGAATPPPAATMQPPRRTAAVAPAKDPTDTAENKRFKQTYAADRTLNRSPSERFAPDGM